MRFGRIIHTEKATSGTTYRVREIVGNSHSLAVTIGRGKNAIEVGTFSRSNLEDVSTWIDEADEETRCLMAEARVEFGF